MVTIEAHWVPLGPIASPLTISTHTQTHTQTQTRTGTHTHSDDIPWMASNIFDVRAAVCMCVYMPVDIEPTPSSLLPEIHHLSHCVG